MENTDYFLSNVLVLWLQNIDTHIFPFHIPLLFNYKFWNQHGSVISNTNENQLKVHVILPLNNTTSKKEENVHAFANASSLIYDSLSKKIKIIENWEKATFHDSHGLALSYE